MVRVTITKANANSANVDSEVNGTRGELINELLLAIRRLVTVLSNVDESDFESTLDSVYVSLLTNHKE